MELSDAIKSRTSIRSFTDEKINLEDIKNIINLAGYAPSVNNYQPWKYIVITNHELMQNMAGLVIKKITQIPLKKSIAAENLRSQVTWYSTFFKDAPAIIALAIIPDETVLEKAVQLSHEEINKIRNYPDIQSAGASIQNLLLAATEKGYGTCWLSGPMFAKTEIETMLNITAPWSLLTFVAIGKAKNIPKLKEKLNLADSIEIFD
ncbi:MAG: nitroreductase family protein [Bacteroidales bacterium]|nr:nitroreductase family protein [Bacteroidales bacterium]